MPVEVISEVPSVCRARFVSIDESNGWKLRGRCCRAANHSDQHFDVVLGYAWTDGTRPRRVWLHFDAADLTLHFDCN